MCIQSTNCVVVLNFNDWKSCVTLINKIQKYKSIDNIVVVDNCSTDDSYYVFKEMYDENEKINIIKSDKNGGYAYGNNLGCNYAIKVLNAKFVTIANPDIFFSDVTMKRMLDFYVKHQNDKIGIVGCMMKCHSSIDLPTAWKRPRYQDCILENLMVLRKIVGDKTKYTNDYFASDNEVAVEVIAGSFFTIDCEAFCEVQGFDNDTFLYYEENILAYKLSTHGYTNYIVTGEYYDHMHSISINKTFSSLKARLDLAFASRYIYSKKYLKCGKLKLAWLHITYIVGRMNYLLLKTLMQNKKMGRKESAERKKD